MRDSPLCNWRHGDAEMTLCAVRWSRRSALRNRDGEARLREALSTYCQLTYSSDRKVEDPYR
jgi:hypothetical protein